MIATTVRKTWRLAAAVPEEIRQRFPDLHPVAVQLLANRGIVTQEAVDEFLLPDYGDDLHDPALFRDMDRACARVWDAIARGEPVVVHGDYDADGVTGSAVLLSTFRAVERALGKAATVFSSYIPHREKEGYGVRSETVLAFAEQGKRLMITVDCGIGCAAEIALAKERGIDTIIVDHHQIPERVPECVTLHPLVEGETYPYKSLAAVGVAFKFACGFIRYAEARGCALERGFEKWLLDLVAIATVTDVMPLVGENRTLEKYGLIVLNKTRRHGLRKIIETAGLALGSLDTVSVGFSIGPRLNAASRMEHGTVALETLMAETPEDAQRFADRLQQLNSDRQRYTEEIMRAARAQVAADPPRRVCVVAGEGWSAGIVGLVAGKLVSELGMPAFVFGKDGERIVGSGRSVRGFDLVKAMDAAKGAIAKCGGHPQACGLTIMGEANLESFKGAIAAYAERVLRDEDLVPVVEAECAIRHSQITWGLVEALAQFEPFGEGNPRPKFLIEGLTVTSVDRVGKTKAHVRIGVVGDAPKELKLIGFNLAERAEGIGPGSRIDVMVEIGVDQWNGNRRIQVKAVDVRPSQLVS